MKSHAEYFASKFLKRLKIIKVNLLMLKSIFNKSESTASFIHIFIFEDNEILIRIVNLVYVRINFDVYLKINLTFKPFSLLQFYWFWDLFQKQLEYGKKTSLYNKIRNLLLKSYIFQKEPYEISHF